MRATVTFIANDFPPTDLDAVVWGTCDEVSIDRYWNGDKAPEGRSAKAGVLWSDSALYVRFDASQAEPLVVNDAPQTSSKTLQLWERDVCEMFLAPDARNRRRYFEFEIAPTGEWLDLVVD